MSSLRPDWTGPLNTIREWTLGSPYLQKEFLTWWMKSLLALPFTASLKRSRLTLYGRCDQMVGLTMLIPHPLNVLQGKGLRSILYVEFAILRHKTYIYDFLHSQLKRAVRIHCDGHKEGYSPCWQVCLNSRDQSRESTDGALCPDPPHSMCFSLPLPNKLIWF